MPGCELLPYDTAAGHCRACGQTLPSTRKSWCSPDCRNVYDRNHYWDSARRAAIRRDRGCVKCGWVRDEYDQTCDGQLFLWSCAALRNRGPDNWLEVNHVTPRQGAGYGTGCAHHLSGLETLCHRCHIKVTRRQRIDQARQSTSHSHTGTPALHQRALYGQRQGDHT